ncbi:hypothetical protein NEMBOFW57_002325 [Staphylotrichum longicolle]|uniref:Uncharacterized protein n=1 Tax=Staphylotrichum longicolle TaxID=669026 RepID=A0AAD4I3I3_9PEZI|nr:hypothetical protein NEMBOFW57_002325 [Staphylotrichum longicolle]
MLALLPFRKPLGSLDARFAKHILLPNRQPKMEESPFSIGFRPSSPVESRLPRDREDPCSFRTRLIDPMTDIDADVAFESTDKLEGEDLRFDDIQCISVGRSVGKLGVKFRVTALASEEKEKANEGRIANELPQGLDSTPKYNASSEKYGQLEAAEPSRGAATILTFTGESQGTTIIQKTHSDLTTYHNALASENDSDSDSDGDVNIMETMNMPFWNLPARQTRQHARHASDTTIPDDMSIISDVSLIPTYFPSDVMKQQRPQHRHLVKRLIRAKARAARQTMRELKRSCRDAVGTVFVESGAAQRGPKCVAVGSAL